MVIRKMIFRLYKELCTILIMAKGVKLNVLPCLSLAPWRKPQFRAALYILKEKTTLKNKIKNTGKVK